MSVIVVVVVEEGAGEAAGGADGSPEEVEEEDEEEDGKGRESLVGAMMCSVEKRGKVTSLNSLRMLALFVCSD